MFEMFKIENTWLKQQQQKQKPEKPQCRHGSPWPLPEVPCGLTKEQWLEAEGSDEVIPACDQLDFPLIPHLKEKYTEGSWCARPHCSRKVPCQGATVGK